MPEQIENRMVAEKFVPKYRTVCVCESCSSDIYEGDYFYDFDDDIICADCMEDYVNEHFRRCIDG